jgi:SdrD B-like domain
MTYFLKKIQGFSVAWLLIFGVYSIGQAQTAGPCGTTLTITNATNPFVADGRVTISNITGRYDIWLITPTGEQMTISPAYEVLNNATRNQWGLQPGTYSIKADRYDINWNWLCSNTVSFTVGSTALPTCAATEIGGAVFNDFDADGVREVNEKGAPDIVVRAFNTANTQVATATTNASGNYKLTGLTAGQAYRLEFTWADTYLQSGAQGSSSASSIQFVNAGTCNANFGVNLPANYCQIANPYLLTPCYVNGNPTAPAVSPMDAAVAYPYNAYTTGGKTTQTPPATHAATIGQVGALWGVAYQKSSKYAYSSAVMRRFSGFGPLGTGGIYKFNMTNPAAPTVSNWIDVKTIGIPTGNDTRDGTTANSLATSPGSPAWDVNAYNAVGKVGIGGIDFNDYGDTLWLVNLNDKKLYGIRNVSPTTPPTSANVIGGFTVTLPAGFSCPSGAADFRPWGVKYYKGMVYVTAMCTGESTPWTPANMRGYILSFNPKNTAAGFSVVANFPLNYSRVFYNNSTGNFQSWVNTSFTTTYHSQPIVSDLEFDFDGSLIVGISDRGGLQSGNQNYNANTSDYSLIEGNSYGDIIKICKVGSSYVVEGNAGCIAPTNPVGTNEIYWGDHGPFSGNTTAFNENAAGALTFLPSSGAFLTTAQDPSAWYAGGTVAINTTSGSDVRRYSLYDASVSGAQGKATGLGDLEIVGCNDAPIEIGNRVWVDSDRDGIQDAGELGISGVTVRLYNATTNTLVATTTTNALGQYKFANLLELTQYRIEINENDAALSVKKPTTTNAGSNDFIDSDGVENGDIVSITLTTGRYGENNHSYDFGFEPCSQISSSGTIGSNQSVCGASLDPAVLTELTAPTGGSGALEYQWQVSTDNTTWTDISGATSSTYDPATITATRYYRRGARRAGCAFLYSNVVTIDIKPIPNISASNASPYCEGSMITLTSTPNPTGGTFSWSFSGGGFSSASQNPTRTGATTAMSGTYTVVYTASNGCTTTANTVVTVSGSSVGGTISPALQTICAGTGTVPVQHTLSGHSGTIVRWEYQVPGGSTWANWGGGGSTTAPSNCCFGTIGTWKVRAVIQSSVCAQTTSSEAIINVVADPSVSVSGGGITICTGGTATFTATPSNGTGTCTVQWQSSTDNTTFTDISGATGNSYTTSALSATTYFRARINCTGQNCDQAVSSSQVITVVGDPTVAVVTTAPSVCPGGSVQLSATPNGGTGTCTVQWQSSPDGTNWTNISGATGNAYTTPALSGSTRYRAQVTCTGSGCCN